MSIRGIFGQPFVDLERHLDLSGLDAIHEEICLGLTEAPVDYTGGSHRAMGIMPPSRLADVHADYGEVVPKMTPAQWETFRSLSDDPASLPEAPPVDAVGEERDHPLSRRQMLWLEHRFGVYFPWKVYFEMIPNDRWEDKSDAETASGPKAFTRHARTFFPKTVAFVRSLPFERIGRCNIMGLSSYDHGTVHRDGDPDVKKTVDHFITVCPGGDKRLFLWDEDAKAEVVVQRRAYWFDDSDYHGVLADPFFRYSFRVDGVFRPDFLAKLEAAAGATR